jgi:hypothetical protein
MAFLFAGRWCDIKDAVRHAVVAYTILCRVDRVLLGYQH